jgi:hypothetical protein
MRSAVYPAERGDVSTTNRLNETPDWKTGEEREREPWPDARDAEQKNERAPFPARQEPVEVERVLPDVGVDPEAERLPLVGKLEKARQRETHLVPDAPDVEHDPFRTLLLELSRESTDHPTPPDAPRSTRSLGGSVCP